MQVLGSGERGRDNLHAALEKACEADVDAYGASLLRESFSVLYAASTPSRNSLIWLSLMTKKRGFQYEYFARSGLEVKAAAVEKHVLTFHHQLERVGADRDRRDRVRLAVWKLTANAFNLEKSVVLKRVEGRFPLSNNAAA